MPISVSSRRRDGHSAQGTEKRPHRLVEYTDRRHAHVCSPPKIAHSPRGDPDSRLIHGYAGPREPTCQTASRSVQPFSQDSSPIRTHGQTANTALAKRHAVKTTRQ